jgi:hypothetical protein
MKNGFHLELHIDEDNEKFAATGSAQGECSAWAMGKGIGELIAKILAGFSLDQTLEFREGFNEGTSEAVDAMTIPENQTLQ